MNKAAIAEQYKNLDREELIAQLLIAKAELKVEKAQTEWLDTLANELRDGEEADESTDLYNEYVQLKRKVRQELTEKYEIEL